MAASEKTTRRWWRYYTELQDTYPNPIPILLPTSFGVLTCSSSSGILSHRAGCKQEERRSYFHFICAHIHHDKKDIRTKESLLLAEKISVASLFVDETFLIGKNTMVAVSVTRIFQFPGDYLKQPLYI